MDKIYKSIEDTLQHKEFVGEFLSDVLKELGIRAVKHDNSKLVEPEVKTFAEYGPKLKNCIYGSKEYKQYLTEMNIALDHHYKANSHHPENALFSGLIKQEEWRDVVGFEGYYLVSNWGRVKSTERLIHRNNNGDLPVKEKIMTAHKTPKGYYRIQLTIDNIRKNVFIHQIVAEAFIPNPHNKPQVNHKNTVKTDNYVDNLEWCDNSENQLHAYETGLQKCKYVVHCEELNITTLGTGEMERKLKELGFDNARDSSILACINDESGHHLNLHFTGYIIENYEIPKQNLINKMTLIDLIEMLCDWKASTLRHDTGDIMKSIDINQKRFGYSDELKEIFKNTIRFMQWDRAWNC